MNYLYHDPHGLFDFYYLAFKTSKDMFFFSHTLIPKEYVYSIVKIDDTCVIFFNSAHQLEYGLSKFKQQFDYDDMIFHGYGETYEMCMEYILENYDQLRICNETSDDRNNKKQYWKLSNETIKKNDINNGIVNILDATYLKLYVHKKRIDEENIFFKQIQKIVCRCSPHKINYIIDRMVYTILTEMTPLIWFDMRTSMMSDIEYWCKFARDLLEKNLKMELLLSQNDHPLCDLQNVDSIIHKLQNVDSIVCNFKNIDSIVCNIKNDIVSFVNKNTIFGNPTFNIDTFQVRLITCCSHIHNFSKKCDICQYYYHIINAYENNGYTLSSDYAVNYFSGLPDWLWLNAPIIMLLICAYRYDPHFTCSVLLNDIFQPILLLLQYGV